ncbi:MAG: fatty acid hydroxylase family protein [Deltaproteobacteria bacterium]|nr:MAG: fatty acid hydroxylase family protein [Deltaproteobacteria bacterium]
MARTVYNWQPYRLSYKLYPLLIVGAVFALWLSPPGWALFEVLTTSVPDVVLAAGGLAVLAVTITYGSIALFHLADEKGWPAWIARRKIQQPFVDPKRPPWPKALAVLLRNHLILGLGLAGFGYLLHLRGWTAGPVPAWYIIALQLLAMGLITEVLFYSAHRLLHVRWFYRRIHHVHHEYRTPTAWSAQYAHPIEYFFGNMLPIAIPMLVVAPDLITLWAFGAIVLLNTQLVHSGYQLPLAPWAVSHDLHHYKVNVNYGSTGLMDTLAGSRLDHPDGNEAAKGARPSPLLPLPAEAKADLERA